MAENQTSPVSTRGGGGFDKRGIKKSPPPVVVQPVVTPVANPSAAVAGTAAEAESR